MILLVDNYDSFVYNLRRYLMRLGQQVVVCRNDQVPMDLIESGHFEAVVISPGPQSPNEAGGCLELVQRFHARVPILGVCLGHQVIWQALGGRIARAGAPMHGRTSQVRYDDRPIFRLVDNPFVAARYHSLVASDACPPELLVTAWSDDGEIMAFEHRRYPVFGWQFHPESILTRCGYQLLANFLQQAHVERPPTELPQLDLQGAAVLDAALVLGHQQPSATASSAGSSSADTAEPVESETAPFAVLPGTAWF
jgi:anthranilate synthase/aminodeoxychorismate synthase-like glutamine amidotransferase